MARRRFDWRKAYEAQHGPLPAAMADRPQDHDTEIAAAAPTAAEAPAAACHEPPPATLKRIAIPIDAATAERLEAMAAEAGQPVSRLAASIVAHVLEDDARAHGERRS